LAQTCKNFLEKNEQKIGLLFSEIKTKFVEFEDEDAFLNLNFYEEYEKFKSELK
ncbi:molybdenum cofactor guanylyltransferase, partial [Campylobacter jejuni]